MLNAPNGGESWYAGSVHNITWSSTGSIANVRLEYSKDSFVSDMHTIADYISNDGNYVWKVPDDPSATVRVRVSDVSNPSINDTSDRDFTTEGPSASLTLSFPNGGESWHVGTVHDVTWSSTGSIANVRLEYSKDRFFSDVHTIVSSTPNTLAQRSN